MDKIWECMKQVMECTWLIQMVFVTPIHWKDSILRIKVFNLVRMMWFTLSMTHIIVGWHLGRAVFLNFKCQYQHHHKMMYTILSFLFADKMIKLSWYKARKIIAKYARYTETGKEKTYWVVSNW